MNKILNRQAFFADGTPFYRLYTSDGTGYGVRLRFRTAKDNAELVTVVTDSMKADMHKCFTEGRFDYYEVMLHYPEARIIILQLPERKLTKAKGQLCTINAV